MNTIVRGGRVIDPSQNIDAILDVRIRAGVIAELGPSLEAGDAEIIDARGRFVAPGFIDMHVHLRDPGFPHKETLASGLSAAVAGGFTAVACMPNTNPAIDTPELAGKIVAESEALGLARVYPIGAITIGRAGSELAPYHLLAERGAVAFSDDGNAVEDARVLRQAALYARDLRAPFISHCEDARLAAGGVMNEGAMSLHMGLPGSPGIAEDVVTARDLIIAADTGKSWHIAHVTTARSLELVRWARAAGVNVTCEVTPHHLLLGEELFADWSPRAKVNPPLRAESDRQALLAGVRDGTVDVLATDHAPHAFAEKSGSFASAAVGFSGLEIAVGAYAQALADLSPLRFVELLSVNPARVLNVPGGTLRTGTPADLTIFSDEVWTVDARALKSKGKNTPFDGWRFPRRATMTLVGGRVVMYDRRAAIAGTNLRAAASGAVIS